MQYQYTPLPTSPRGIANGGGGNGIVAPKSLSRTNADVPSEEHAAKPISSGTGLVEPKELMHSRAQAHAGELAMAQARQFDIHQLRATWTLHPQSCVFGFWNPVMMLIIFMDCFVQPFISTFRRFIQEPPIATVCWSMSRAAWICYVVDTLMQMFIQVPKADGTGMIKSSSQVMRTYFRSRAFFFDFLTILPWALIHEITTREEKDLGLKDVSSRGFIELLVDLLPILRLCRLRTVKRLTYRYRNMFHVSFAQHIFCECGFGFVLCLHMLACLWSLVGLENPSHDNQTWIKWYWREDRLGDGQSNFKPTASSVYVASLYWALATTTSIGYGDVVPSPTSSMEQLVCVFLMCIAAISWSIIIANAVELVKDMHSQQEDYQKTMDSCEKVFSSNAHLPEALTESIREYFKKSYDLDMQESTQALISRMSPMLQRSLVQIIYADWIEDVPWITRMSGPCLVQAVLRMQNFLYVPGEIIPDARMTSFVHLGSLFIGGRVLAKGDSWGVDMTLEGYMRRRESGFAMNFVSTLGLTMRHLTDVLEDFPEDAWMVRRVSSWMAVRRRVRQIARAKKNMLQENAFERAMIIAEAAKEQEFVQLSDDARYTVKQMNQSFDGLNGAIKSLDESQKQIATAQQEAKKEQATNGEALRSVGARLGALEESMAKVLSLLQDKAFTASPSGPKGAGMFKR